MCCAFQTLSLADATGAAFFGAVFAVVAVFARIARITSRACRACVGFRRVSPCIRCCCLRNARERARDCYGSDNCNSFHGSRIMHLAFLRAQSQRRRGSKLKSTPRLIPTLNRTPFSRLPRPTKTVLTYSGAGRHDGGLTKLREGSGDG